MDRSKIILEIVRHGYQFTQSWVEDIGYLLFQVDIYSKNRKGHRYSARESIDTREFYLCVDKEYAMKCIEDKVIQYIYDKMVKEGDICINNH